MTNGTTTPAPVWTTSHIVGVAAGAIAGAALAPVLFPMAVGAVGAGAVATALGISGATGLAGAIAGGLLGHSVSKS